MSEDTIGQSKEDYLEAILMISRSNKICRITDIARLLSISKPSVSVAVQQLENEGFVYRQESSILLTESGNKIASRMLERHDVFSSWLCSIGIDEEVADSEACEMEHIFSNESFRKIAEFIRNNPSK